MYAYDDDNNNNNTQDDIYSAFNTAMILYMHIRVCCEKSLSSFF